MSSIGSRWNEIAGVVTVGEPRPGCVEVVAGEPLVDRVDASSSIDWMVGSLRQV